jgi:hypothetical protein
MVAAGEGTRQELAESDDTDVSGFERSHRVILGFLDDLGEAKTPSQIHTVLDMLEQLLSEHFSDEEGPDGLFEELRDARPANDSRLKSLQREHREILQTLQALREQVRDVERCLRAINSDKADFLRLVRGHERAESSLVMDTYFVDDGGSG